MIAKSSNCARFAGRAILIAAAIAVSAGPVNAAAKKIKKCQTISKAGFYQLSRNLTTTSTGVCLLISAPGVILNLNGFGLTGPGAGTGIQIAANNVFIDGNDKTGKDRDITNFAIGIEDDGNNAVVENFGVPMNTDTGLYVNGASGSTFGTFGAGNNTKHGIHLRNANRIVIHNLGPSNNGTYGVWAETSSNNLIDQFFSTTNSIADFYFGCSATGPAGAACVGFNSASNVVASGQMVSSPGEGMAIDEGSLGNVISDTGQNANATFDVFDGNTLCGTNLWFENVYTTSNEPTCTNE